MGLPPMKAVSLRFLLICGACLITSCVGFACQPPKIVLNCRGKELLTFPSDKCGFNKTEVHCLILSNNRLQNVTKSMFSSLKDLETLMLDDNGLTIIQPQAFNGLVSLRVLILSKNKIKHLSSSMFSGLTNLTELRLDFNEVTSIESGAFNHLTSLRILSMGRNQIKHLTSSMFSGLTNLQMLTIEENGLMSVHPGALDDLISLTELNLEKNQLEEIPQFNVSSKVTTLRLAFNPIATLHISTMKNYPHLVFLYLTESRLTRLPSKIFSYNRKLRRLNLFNTPLEYVDDDAFDGVELRELNLEGTKITNLPGKGMESLNYLNIRKVKSLWELPFKSFQKLWHAKVEYHFHCCLFEKYYDNAEASNPNLKNYSVVKVCPTSTPSSTTVKPKSKTDEKQSSGDIFDKHKGSYEKDNHTITLSPTSCINLGDSNVHVQDEKKELICEPQPDAFNPCEDLLGTMGLRICTWFVLIFALVGNGLQLIVLFTSKRNTAMYRVLMCNLSLANLFMGMYLFMLAVADARTYSEYQNHAKAWQFGPGCNIAGFISILSTELAVYTLTVITVERYFTIVHPMKLDMHLSTRQIIILMIFGWVFALIMAILPIFNISSYQRVAICLPFDVETLVSKMYVTALLTTNGLAFFTVLFCYTRMYFSLGGTSCSSAASSATRVESRVAKKMALLVFSNFTCWFPIALFSLIAVYGSPLIDVPTSKFLLVFVYPINAFTNPYLYALGTKHFQLDFLDLLKRLGLCPKGSERLRNKLLDQIASLPNTSKAYMGSRSSINMYGIPSRYSVDSSPKTLHSRSVDSSATAKKVSSFSCRFLPIPNMSFSSCGDPTESTERSRASSESTSDFSTSQIQPLLKRQHKNGNAREEGRRSSAREIIIGGNLLDKNENGCQPPNNSPEDGQKSLDNEEIYENESCVKDENAKNNSVPVVMVTSC
ncbi:lutropin-choriogonadotropic hormone receptor-like isoform X2 [Actinia tenebrosa]|nr:lutropin-choriogonadotropic hormone receptor-like isoform X2 [Actinia tenebrosa]XP_031549744.1 lutropin-choriogonadotropic hormone receptor-like isoform X2 [Actinia tenebrosa]XP_031549745.1 lutropin-choriogonadotropic hormone receptor-like isoform X2 [Actinia tenebrosa]XP_031549747.1 lutropin-choriogonadotropic hormone receptor-like isoform X2 [Actinia tenebrosa]